MQDIESLEQMRCQALLAGDLPALTRLLAPDLVHVHANGAVQDRTTYLADVRDRLRFVHIDRGPLLVRLHGGMAVATGMLSQHLHVLDRQQDLALTAFTTQVWREDASGWQQISFQATRIA